MSFQCGFTSSSDHGSTSDYSHTDDYLQAPDERDDDLSDELSDLDDMDLDSDSDSASMQEDAGRKSSRDSGYWSPSVRTPLEPRMPPSYLESDDSDGGQDVAKSPFEDLPVEIIQHVAVNLATDSDLKCLMLTSSTFYDILNPPEAAVWKARFLAKYDAPRAHSREEFQIAYQLRRFVLRMFQSLADGHKKRSQVQLDVLRDMVLETYNKSKRHLPTPSVSRNLLAFSRTTSSPWMVTFLSSPLFGQLSRQYGQPHTLFDTLQVFLSHLVLSPQCPMAVHVQSSREHYDIVKVYSWNLPFSTIHQLLPDEEPSSPLRQFPNLSPPRSIPKYTLNMHSVLHIRNFWQRHLIEDGSPILPFSATPSGENTYARMLRDLLRHGYPMPAPWTKPLQSTNHDSLSEKWYGHYSCLHPWPKSRRDLEERQSCGEGWDQIDPLTLDLTTSSQNDDPCFWPPVFSSIPAFSNTTPNLPGLEYVRGIAPFLDLSADKAISNPTSAAPNDLKYHPYLSLRVRGVLHPLAPQSSIPGWRRLVMVLYKPTTVYLCRVLEHALEEYGGSFGTAITSQLAQSSDPFNISTAAPTAAVTAMSALMGNGGAATTTAGGQGHHVPQTQLAIPANMQTQLVDPHVAEQALRRYLRQRLSTAPLNDKTKFPFDKESIAEWEDAFQHGKHLEWLDIEYAYAYEGILLPGGKIMLGKWWRVGLFGLGEGMEVGVDGEGVIVEHDVDPDDDMEVDTEGQEGQMGDGVDCHAVGEDGHGPGDGNGGEAAGEDNSTGQDNTADTSTDNRNRERRQQGLERGPFVFWC